MNDIAERPHALYSPSRLPMLELCPGWQSDGAGGPLADRGTGIGERLACWLVNGMDPLADAPDDWRDAITTGVELIGQIAAQWPGVTWTAEDQIHTSITNVSGYADILGRDELLGDTILLENKTGRGDRKPAPENRQLQALALGLLEAGATEVHAYLIECDKATVSYAKFDDARHLRSNIKVLVLNATYCKESDLSPCSHCRYCARREQCPRVVEAPEAALAVIPDRMLTPHDFAGSLTPEGLAETLRRITPLVSLADDYLGALKQRAMTLIEAGADVPGWMVKTMNGQRAWSDEEMAMQALTEAGHDLDGLTELVSPAQVEKKLGKGTRALIDAYTVMSTRRSLVSNSER